MATDARDLINGLLDSEHQGSIGTPEPDVPPGTAGGTDGADTLTAAPGGATLSGGGGDDVIAGGAGDDALFGGAGDDTIDGGGGNDTIVGDGAGGGTLTVTIRFDGGEADFLNSLGAYWIDPATGELRGATLLTENASPEGSGGTMQIGDTMTFTAPAGVQIGLFLISNGGSLNDFAGLGAGRLEFRNADGTPATVGSTAPQLVFVADDGTETLISGGIFHTAGFGANAGLNTDGLQHTQGLGSTEGSVSFGFEDLAGLGDGDFDDVLLTVSIEGAGSFPNPHAPLENPVTPVTPGDDSLTGGTGDDVIFGGGGNDTLIGGPGADAVYGGADRDTVIGATPGDVIDGGGDGDDFDRLDLRGGPPVSVVIVGEDGESGLVFDRTTGGDSRFFEIEEILTDPDPGRDGIVRGGVGGTLIDLAYVDTDGDRVDAGDNIFPGRGADDDIVVGQGGNDTIYSFAGDDLVVAGGGDDVVSAGEGADTVYGGAGNDYIDGQEGNDTLFGGSGDDTVLGGDGDDDVYGGSGDDILATGSGDDTARGEDGNDYIDGFTGDDKLFGGAGQDSLLGGQGNDTVHGGDGDDILVGNPGDDELYGDAGDDLIEGNDGNDTLFGGAGNDTIAAGPGANTVDAGDDRDLIIVTGNDTNFVDGGEGGDDFDTLRVLGPAEIEYDADNPENGTVFYLNPDGVRTGITTRFVNIERVVIIDLSELDGVVEGTEAGELIDANYTGDPEGDRIDNFDSLENITDYTDLTQTETSTFVEIPGGPVRGDNRDAVAAGGGDDTVLAGLGDDVVFGGEGDDLIYGALGADELVGDAGNDTIYGGLGVDRLFGGAGNDALYGGEQTDVIFGGAGDDLISGDGGNDILFGVTGNNTIIGGLGSDTITGGDGNDTIFGGEGDDVIETGLGDNVVETGSGFNHVTAGAGNDRLFGGSSADTLFGGGGNDTIEGLGGDDEIFGGDGDDVLIGGAGRDTIDGGAGNNRISGGTPGLTGIDAVGQTPDVIRAGDGDNIIDGSSGDDLIEVGDGANTIAGGSGNDTIIAGDGGNLIFGGGEVDIFTGIVTEEDDSRSLRDASAIEGNSAVIRTGQGADTIYGTSGNDSIDGGGGADLIYGKGGQDTLNGQQGADTIFGGEGDDRIDGGEGADSLFGDAGQDTIEGGVGGDGIDGGAGDDSLYGGIGDDALYGGDGQDRLFGGTGNDTLNGGAGDDTLDGGDDRDVFVIDSNLGRTQVFGGSGGDDFDRLDLTGLPRSAWRLVSSNPDSDGNGIDGVIELLDGNGAVTGRITFENIEQIVPCFTPGTLIATPRGERPIEELRVGDKVLTRDNGIQAIRWIGSRSLDHLDLQTNPHLRPVLIRQGSLGNGLPERDMMVSPNHRILVANDRTALYFDEHEVLVAAKHLVAGDGVRQVQSSGTTYVHFMFDRHEVVLSNGAWTESFQPGDYTLAGMGNAQRNEIFEIFPELRNRTGQKSYAAARKTLKGFEARLLAR